MNSQNIKVTTEKVQFFFTQFFYTHSNKFFIFLNIILCGKECERKKERVSKRRGGHGLSIDHFGTRTRGLRVLKTLLVAQL
jgi:predicted ABC-type ATPase